MRLKSLAEAIILQSIEDLWDEEERGRSIKFFKEDGFSICADIAGICRKNQLDLLTMVQKASDNTLQMSSAAQEENKEAASRPRGVQRKPTPSTGYKGGIQTLR